MKTTATPTKVSFIHIVCIENPDEYIEEYDGESFEVWCAFDTREAAFDCLYSLGFEREVIVYHPKPGTTNKMDTGYFIGTNPRDWSGYDFDDSELRVRAYVDSIPFKRPIES